MRVFTIFLLAILISNCSQPKKEKPLNILFIAVDDLRTDLGCYGNPVVQSPNLDQLAAEGTLFTRHYVQVPTCGASRYALLTGLRPQNRAYLRNDAIVEYISKAPEKEAPESFIHHLKRSGYHTVGIGKISHSADGYVYGYEEEVSEKRELPHSWSDLAFNAGKWETGWNAFFAYADGENRQSMKKEVKPYEKGAVDDQGYPDGLSTQLAIEKLGALKDQDQPFLLALGLFKPHLPFTAPEKYWDLYDRSEVPLSPNPKVPKNVHLASLHPNGEFNQYKLGEEQATLDTPVSEAYARKLKHAYYAGVSYIDAQIGLVLAELKRLEMDDNTVIVVWGDHGWHLGDQQIWGKHTLFENALKSTLIMKVPGLDNKAVQVNSIVETVDLYPTIIDLAGLAMPHDVDGESLVTALNGRDSDNLESRAFSYFKNGVSMRTPRYRITKYKREAQPNIELYDHLNDPNETINVATENPTVVADLLPELDKAYDKFHDNLSTK
ncbi:MAG: sulfatase [Saprospiraceae bacterium]